MGCILSLLFSSFTHTPKLIFSSSPIDLPLRKFKPDQDIDILQDVSMQSFVQSICPSLTLPYYPPWWMHNGHVQTGYNVIGDFTKFDNILYRRKLLRTVDGGTLGLDFTPFEDKQLPDDTPILVLLHGLTGGSYESYVRAILAPACTPVDKGGLGYRGVVLNFRGCAGVPVTSPRLYSVGCTEDLRVALTYLTYKYPKAPLLGVGFSLGANVLTRYLAEEGEESRLIAGCALACPWNTARNIANLESSWFLRSVYSKALASNVLHLLKRNFTALSQFKDHPISQALFDVLSLDSPYMFQIDTLITRLVGGSSSYFPFPTQVAFYEWAASDRVIPDIRVPYLAINAKDDPIVKECPADCGGNGWVTLACTERGGHLGWFETDKNGQMKRWVKKPVLEWCKGLVERLSLDEHGNIRGRKCRPFKEVNGFLKEVGRDECGCQELAGMDDQIVDFQSDGQLLLGL